MYEFLNPPDLEQDVALDSLISVNVVGNDIIFSTLLITINGEDAYSGSSGFSAGYSGVNSSFTFLPSGSIFGEDAYRIVIDSYSNLQDSYSFAVNASVETTTTPRTTAWQFQTTSISSWSFTIEDYIAPWMENNLPTSFFCLVDANISVDVLDDFGISDIKIYVNSANAFDFPNVFYPHYDGVNSAITPISGGYSIVIDPDNLELGADYTVLIVAEDLSGNVANLSWTFGTLSDSSNTVYLSNINGLYAIEQTNLVGECQSELRLVLSTSTTPSLPTNRMSSIHGIKNEMNSYLALSLGLSGAISPVIADQHGAIVVKNESEQLTYYATGFDVAKAQITDNGILYYINKTLNSIDCYHGVIYEYNTLDYTYSSSSTPSILSGEILSLFVLSGEYAKLYVGSEAGLTIINTNNFDVEGLSDGYESSGTSTTYSIASGTGQFKIIGGNSPEVRDVVYSNGIVLVVTDDGITQILEEENRKIYFMDSSMLPSTTIRKITNS